VRRVVKIELLISLRTAKSLGLTFGPFGNGTPTNPFSYDLCLPGQFFHAKVHYNHSRDYDLNMGRYIESDPQIAGQDQYLCVCVQYAGQYR
jgi:hypothetical protein